MSSDRFFSTLALPRCNGFARCLAPHLHQRSESKIARVEELKSRGRQVLMVGDGLNDAPALPAAHVSLSPVTAAHLTQAATDAVFLGDRLVPVVEALGLARQARRIMRETLRWPSFMLAIKL